MNIFYLSELTAISYRLLQVHLNRPCTIVCCVSGQWNPRRGDQNVSMKNGKKLKIYSGNTFPWNCIVIMPRIPLDVNDKTRCNISRGSTIAALLEKTSLILWDEAPMTSSYCFEGLDRSLMDVLSANDSARSSSFWWQDCDPWK
ncbi:hypothetical protein QYE76_028668 [Lolium multiflorum]|uniref:ATP-dependent DNA helicase n=1 Tax=Lolium multiflorum TaxID=4521 RepID=A0AAD8QLD0_LOLMU|nr:hypothetical protein QYE76_028668 [Lolium multiflorum]